MSYTFTISGATTVDIPVNRDLTGYALKIVLDKGGSAAPVEVTSGLVAGANKVTLTIPANNINAFTDADYRIVGTKGGTSVDVQSGVIKYSETSGGSRGLAADVEIVGPVTVTPNPTGDLVRTVQSKVREDFAGSAVDANFWTVTTGPGMTVAVTNSELRIDAGTTVNSVTTLRSKQSWSGAYRVMFVSAANLLSQRIANQEFQLRVTNAAGTSYAAWAFAGTTHTTGVLKSANAGVLGVDQAQTAAASTATPGIFEVENFIDEVYFHSRVSDSVNARASTNAKNRQTPDPNEEMFIEIRIANGSTAPASNTRLSLDAVLVQDISELTTEITGGRGGGGASQSIPVTWAGNLGVSVNNALNVYPAVISGEANAMTTTNLTATSVYTQATQDWGATVATRPTHARVTVMHLAGVIHGTLALDQSADGTNWRRTWLTPIPSDGAYHTFDIPMHMRYYRFVFGNGATAQTAFWLGVTFLRTDGATDIDKVLSFPMTAAAGQAAASGASTIFPTIDLGANHMWDRVRAVTASDQTGTIYLQQSMDNSTWFTTPNTSGNASVPAGVAAGSALIETPIVARYVRLQHVNGATAASNLRVVVALVSL